MRESGYLRIQKDGFRRGDNAEMAIIQFVDMAEFEANKDAIEEVKPEPKKAAPKKAAPKAAPKKDSKTKEEK